MHSFKIQSLGHKGIECHKTHLNLLCKSTEYALFSNSGGLHKHSEISFHTNGVNYQTLKLHGGK